MAQICYLGEGGKLVTVKNPTSADDAEMWRAIGARLRPALEAEFMEQLRAYGSVFAQQAPQQEG